MDTPELPPPELPPQPGWIARLLAHIIYVPDDLMDPEKWGQDGSVF